MKTALVMLLATTFLATAQGWLPVTEGLMAEATRQGAKPEWPGGCSGVAVNRQTGVVSIKVVGLGIWQNHPGTSTWTRIDSGRVTGRDETGWATSVDADHPSRMASFSLDGSAGWTMDGTNWVAFANLGRNWDYGSVDWSAPVPRTIVAARHETTPPGEVHLSQDGGASWRLLSIRVSDKRGQPSMVGALGTSTLIWSQGEGVHRSTDAGMSWARVSDATPQTRIPVGFRGRHYLGTHAGLLVSEDRGATWKARGKPVDVWLGPFFGSDDRHLAIVGRDGAFRTRDAGETWERVADLKSPESGFHFTPNWFGCYAWDPVNEVLYASSMGNPVFRWKP